MKKKTGVFSKLLIAFLLVFSLITIITLQTQLTDLKERRAELSKQIDEYSENVERMRYDLSLSREEYIEKYAREVLGYHKNGEIVFKNNG